MRKYFNVYLFSACIYELWGGKQHFFCMAKKDNTKNTENIFSKTSLERHD